MARAVYGSGVNVNYLLDGYEIWIKSQKWLSFLSAPLLRQPGGPVSALVPTSQLTSQVPMSHDLLCEIFCHI